MVGSECGVDGVFGMGSVLGRVDSCKVLVDRITWITTNLASLGSLLSRS
jgi:hypothetical protein